MRVITGIGNAAEQPLAQDLSSLRGGLTPGKGLAALAIAGILAARTANECHNALSFAHIDTPFTPCGVFAFVVWYWWAGIAVLLWQVGTRHLLIGSTRVEVLRLSWRGAALHAAAGSVVAMAHMAMLKQTVILLAPVWPAWGHAYFTFGCITGERFGIDLTIYGFIYICLSLIRAQIDVSAALVQKFDLERQLSRAQLQALQMQLQPHFLFNSLNCVASLVDLNRNREAGQMLAHLNTILRTTLSRSTPEKVRFLEELRVVESYLAIQQTRFADRLEVRFDTTPDALEGLVPSFLLQPIVENAIKHGIAPMEAGGILETSAKRVGDILWLRVRDNGSGAATTTTKGHGIGLQNTRERLMFFYPGRHLLEVGMPATGGYEVTIQIPFERQPA
jgi:signal transduction histidine kinase